MSGNTWSVNIVAGESYASFVPDVYVPPGKTASTALEAQAGDVVSWFNATKKDHQIWQSGTTPVQLTDPIVPQKSSSPGYNVALPGTETTGTIDYYCSIHPEEKGTINVIA